MLLAILVTEAMPERGPMLDAELDDFMHSAAALLRLPLEQEWRGAVREHLAVVLRFGGQLTTFPLPDELEPAAIFEPPPKAAGDLAVEMPEPSREQRSADDR
jgi:hypothetical protein